MKVVSYLQAKDESRKGNLRRYLTNITNIVPNDLVVVYDDGSTDDSHDIYKEFGIQVINGPGNEFTRELFIKQKLLDYCRDKLNGDWICWSDADTVFNRAATDNGAVLDVIRWAEDSGVDGIHCRWINCYLHPRWARHDQRFNQYGQANLYKITPNLRFNPKEGLHHCQTPTFSNSVDCPQDLIKVIHLGFASPQAIAAKYVQYWKCGQRNWELERIISMHGLDLRSIPDEEMPSHFCPPLDPAPKSVDFEALRKQYPPFSLDDAWVMDQYRVKD